jgi:hypothetical protein
MDVVLDNHNSVSVSPCHLFSIVPNNRIFMKAQQEFSLLFKQLVTLLGTSGLAQ